MKNDSRTKSGVQVFISYHKKITGSDLLFSSTSTNGLSSSIINGYNAFDNKYLHYANNLNVVISKEYPNGIMTMKNTTDLLARSGLPHVTEVKKPSVNVRNDSNSDWDSESIFDDDDFTSVLSMTEDQLDGFLACHGIDYDNTRAFSSLDSCEENRSHDANVRNIEDKIKERKHKALVQETREKTVGEAISEIIYNIEEFEREYKESIESINRLMTNSFSESEIDKNTLVNLTLKSYDSFQSIDNASSKNYSGYFWSLKHEINDLFMQVGTAESCTRQYLHIEIKDENSEIFKGTIRKYKERISGLTKRIIADKTLLNSSSIDEDSFLPKFYFLPDQHKADSR